MIDVTDHYQITDSGFRAERKRETKRTRNCSEYEANVGKMRIKGNLKRTRFFSASLLSWFVGNKT